MSTRSTSSKVLKTKGGVLLTRGRARRDLHAVDTNVFSYDRTDPFTALNVLRKLLSSLPSRIGGCQYKLTSEEHKLSLHLLTIMEPFVGLSPSRRTLMRQPTELLDTIVSHIDTKRDLLALALSCRRMHAIIFPRHYDYRVIRCKASSLSVWNHFIVHRGLARNVRRLEILDERSTEPVSTPPDILTSDTDMESTDDELSMHTKQERYLVSALSHSIWSILLKCQRLRQVQIHDNLVFGEGPYEGEGQTSSSSKRSCILPGLRSATFQSTKHAYGASKIPDLARISGMLNHCPNLETLAINYTQRRTPGFLSPVADDFMLCGRWSNLRALTLTNLWCSPQVGFNSTASFLSAHVNLEVLHLDITFSGTAGNGNNERLALVVPPNSLPRLRELKASKELASAVLRCPCDTPGGRPLEIIKGVRLSGSAWDHVFLASLKRHGAGVVKRLELAGWNDMDDIRRLVECVPKLVWLDVGKRSAGAAGAQTKTAPLISTNVVEWATVLSGWPELTTFHGVRFFYEVSSTDPTGPLTLSDRSRVRKNEEVASVLAWKCGMLRRLDHWEESSGRVIVLLRDGEKVRYEIRRVKG